MDKAYKIDGIVTGRENIHAANLPFPEGQRVELVVWPVSQTAENVASSKDEIARKLAGLEKLDRWIQKNLPKDMPLLSDEALSRDSIYEGRGL